MKIAYVMYPGACFMGTGDGSKMQAIIWAKALKEKGHQIDFISPWKEYNWESYDIIHVFGFGLWNYDFIHWGSKLNENFVFSPIIDTTTPMWKYNLATFWGCSRLRLFSQNYILRKLKSDVKIFFARTEYEADYLHKGYGINKNRISIVPLSYREDNYNNDNKKEPFCLFVGTMTQKRKNVHNLVLAAKKYGFKLVLVGNTGNSDSLMRLERLIDNAKNIEIKGFVSDDELSELYSKAKVFALPSFNEGVGLVALEAAMHKCNIVITNIGGPKEYYKEGLVHLVDPYNVDSIGISVMEALENDDQPYALVDYIKENYSIDHCVDLLINSYKKILI